MTANHDPQDGNATPQNDGGTGAPTPVPPNNGDASSTTPQNGGGGNGGNGTGKKILGGIAVATAVLVGIAACTNQLDKITKDLASAVTTVSSLFPDDPAPSASPSAKTSPGASPSNTPAPPAPTGQATASPAPDVAPPSQSAAPLGATPGQSASPSRSLTIKIGVIRPDAIWLNTYHSDDNIEFDGQVIDSSGQQLTKTCYLTWKVIFDGKDVAGPPVRPWCDDFNLQFSYKPTKIGHYKVVADAVAGSGSSGTGIFEFDVK
ncbi:hypothetical protein [Streptomyces luteireticuli]|uniref:Uncharacterized protein n=1 Tax=Streptomyces luteireticuli TaxID=173858 RepID=A0ABN0Z306_9ACTN